MKKKFAVLLAAALCAASMIALCACSSGEEHARGGQPVRIGTMPNEHFLPMWVAEQDGFFEDAGVDVELLSFDSAQALSAAIAAGEVDMAMVDVPRAVKLCESGTSMTLEWVTLGTPDAPGSFGVMASSEAPYSTLKEYADYAASHDDEWATAGVGVAANTVPEYVFEKLCERDGVDPASLPVQEVASLPERYSLMAAGKLGAAALPESALRLGEANGMTILAEESEGDSISMSVMAARTKFADANSEDVVKVAQAWDMAAKAIDADPAAYSRLLAEKANLNESIADSYPIARYPMALTGTNGEEGFAHPSADAVDLQLEWMSGKGYSTHKVGYDEATGTFTVE